MGFVVADNGDVTVQGTLYAESVQLANRSARMREEDMDHMHVATDCQVGTASAQTRGLFSARAAGTVKAFEVWVGTAATGDATITVDIKKNGTSILSSTLTVDSSIAQYTPTACTLDTSKTSYSDGDCFEWVISAVSAGSGTLPVNVGCRFEVEESYGN